MEWMDLGVEREIVVYGLEMTVTTTRGRCCVVSTMNHREVVTSEEILWRTRLVLAF
jgi:hypothetical protein